MTGPVAVIPTGHPTSVVQWLGPMPPQGAYLYTAPQPAPAPATDLEKALRDLLQQWGETNYPMSYEGRISQDTLDACAADVLALIDGQAKSSDTQRLEWLMRNISGAELRRLNVWTDASCDRTAIDKAMQPTKGEGE